MKKEIMKIHRKSRIKKCSLCNSIEFQENCSCGGEVEHISSAKCSGIVHKRGNAVPFEGVLVGFNRQKRIDTHLVFAYFNEKKGKIINTEAWVEDIIEINFKKEDI